MNELSKLAIDYFKDKDLKLNEIVTEIDNLKIDVVRHFLENSDDDKVYVIKRSGNLEEYNQDKILRSIKNAADQNGQQLNTSDLEIIMDDVTDNMKEQGRKVFRTYEIKDFVKKALINEGYSRIYDSFQSYIQI